MRRDHLSLILRGLSFGLPLAALMVLGVLWVFEHGQWLPFGLALAASTGILLIASRLLARRPDRYAQKPPASDTWPDAGSAAWHDVEGIAHRVAAEPPPIGDMGAYQALAMNVLDAVGRHFHPASQNPRLELTLGQVVEIGELVLRDLRIEVLDAIPGGRGITLAHLNRMRGLGAYVPMVSGATRVAILANRIRRWIVAWPVALAYELVNAVDASPVAAVQRQIDRTAADLFVRRVGTYAIKAFSDQASLDTAAIRAIAQEKLLRMLVLGPLNAGKSSLVNAIFGQSRVKRDILPCPGLGEELVLDRDDAPRAIVLDSDGFGGADGEAARQHLFDAMGSVDLIIAVTSARQAARHLECQTLDEIRRRSAQTPRRACPPILVAVTHIDLLRPAQEWNPPYDLLDGDAPKEQSIRQAVEAIATDFQVSLDRVIPVSLRAGAEYNVEESLLPAIGAALPDAERAKFLRVVEETRSAEARERVGKSIALLAAIGTRVLNRLVP